MRKTQKQSFEFQCDQIDAVLSQNRVDARVISGTLGPRWQSFRLTIKVGERIDKVKALMAEVALAVGTQSAMLIQDTQGLRIEVARPDPEVIPLGNMLAKLSEQTGPKIPPNTALLGLGHNGQPLVLHLAGPDVAHALIAGTTGSGKSVMVASMALSLAWFNDPADLGLIICDPKGTLQALTQLPHTITVATEPDDIAQALDWASAQMIARGGIPGLPVIVVVVDELADLIMSGKPEVARAITRITQRGRQAGVHLIAATQKPTVAAVGSLAKSNFPIRIVGRVTSPEDAKTATGIAGSGADRLMGSGEFLVIVGGKPITCSGTYVSPRQVAQLANDIAGRWTTSVGLQVEPVPPKLLAPGDETLAQYCDLARSVWSGFRAEDGTLVRGGAIAVARAIFGPDAHGQGSQFRWTQRVVAALEAGAGETEGKERKENNTLVSSKSAPAQPVANDNVITTRPRAVLRCKRTGKRAYRWVVIMYDARG